MGDATSVTGGNRRRVQVRKERKDGFTAAKRQVFLDHLAACCNVARAAAAAGVSTVTANYHRRRDPAFAQQCAEALATGYDNLEAAMLEEAARGRAYAPGPDAATAPGPGTLDRDLALHLLQLRGKAMGQRTGRAGYTPRRVSEKELNESLLAKLELLDRRLKGERVPTRAQVRKMKAPARSRRERGDDDDASPDAPSPLTLPSPRRGEGAGRA